MMHLLTNFMIKDLHSAIDSYLYVPVTMKPEVS